MNAERIALAGLLAFGLACWAPWSVDHPGHVEAGSTFTADVGFVAGAEIEQGPVLCAGLPDDTWSIEDVRWEGTTDGSDAVSGDATEHEAAAAELAAQESAPDVVWSCWSAPDDTYAELATLDFALDIAVPAGASAGTQELVWASWHEGDDGELPAASLVRVDAPADFLDHIHGVEPMGSGPLVAVTWGSGTFLGVTDDGAVATSPDGVQWSIGEPLLADLELLQVAYGGGRFVAWGNQGDAGAGALAWSPDGDDWQTLEVPGPPDCMRRGDGAWLFCIDEGYARVPDASWDDATDNSFDPYVMQPEAAVGRSFTDVHVAADGTVLLWGAPEDPEYLRYDAEDDAWTPLDKPVRGAHRLAQGDGTYVIVGIDPAGVDAEEAASLAAVSADGVDWTTHELDNGLLGDIGDLEALRQTWYIDGQFVAAEHGGTLRTSVDGETWTRHLSGAFLFLRDIARSDDGTWVALGFFGSIHRAVELAAPALPGDPPAAHETLQYEHDLSATGGAAPLEHAVVVGALPDGLALSADGVLAGTPTEDGFFSFTVEVVDDWGRAAQASYTLEVVAAPVITTSELPGGQVDEAYSATLEAEGGAAPLSWTVSGDLPPGLSLDGATLSGTPTEAGTFDLAVTVTDDAGVSDEAQLQVVIDEAPEDTGVQDDPQSDDEETGGCGCATGAPAGGAFAWLLLPLLALRRRGRDGCAAG